jgi:hypothetical protein
MLRFNLEAFCLMLKNKTRPLVCLIALAALLMLGCETTALLSGLVSSSPRVPPTRVSSAPAKKPTRSPNDPYDFVTANTPHCAGGDNSASIVRGSITENGAPLPGQKIQASSGPGAEPISEQPAESDENGEFQVTFVCGGNACNGAFWLWLINDDAEQVSPFVQFIFDNQCRRGTLNFSTR